MTEVERTKVNALELILPDEGEINFIYGRIGSGKTYCATRDIIDDLRRGQVWYVNWIIDWPGYDERQNKWLLFWGLLGLKRKFYNFPKENLHFFEVDVNFINKISSLTDCKIALDEGHIAFDSYEAIKMDIRKRVAILHTRHYNRTYLIISQRPTAVHVTLRANVNRFFKCEKTFDFSIGKWSFVHFRKTEFQDTSSSDIPDESKKRDEHGEETDDYALAVSEKYYWGRQKIFKSYDSKYLRKGLATSQPNYAQEFALSWIEKFKNFIA